MSSSSDCKPFRFIPRPGPVGPTGQTGPTGISGPTGTLATDYAYLYNISAVEIIDNGAALTFDTIGNISAGINFTAGTADITFTNAGVYSVLFYFQAASETNNQITLTVNGTIVTGTYYGGILPEQNHGFTILTIAAGDVLNVINNAGLPTAASADTDGNANPIINTSILITRIA